MSENQSKLALHSSQSGLFAPPSTGDGPVLTVADCYSNRDNFTHLFGVPKHWLGQRWVHLVHNWRTGGSSLTALLSVNFHDSYLKVGHPFTRDGWPVDYRLHPYQVTRFDQLTQWMKAQPSPAILAGHTYAGMAEQLGQHDADLWVTLREPAARLNSGLLRFHRKALKSDHPDGGYVGRTVGHAFNTGTEIEAVARDSLHHELNGMCRRIAGYGNLCSVPSIEFRDDLESCSEIDDRPVDQNCFDLAMDNLQSSHWLYLTDHVIPSVLILESTYGLPPLIHPCSNLVHNPQWNGAGITRLQESLLVNYRSLLESLNPWDVKLYNEARRLFWQRWRKADIDPSRLQARRILQAKPLLRPQLISNAKEARLYIHKEIEQRASLVSSKAVSSWVMKDGHDALFWCS